MHTKSTRHTDLIYDVGMHLGEDSAYYLSLGYRVVAVEANSSLVERCQKRFSREIASGRMSIMAGAIAQKNAPDSIRFFVSNKTVWGTTSDEWAHRNRRLGRINKEISIKRIIFEDILSQFGIPHYMKIDVEGTDDLIIDSVCASRVRPKFISVESEKVDFDKLVGQIEKLERAGFTKFKVAQQASIPGSVAKVRALNGSLLNYRFERHSSGPFGDDLKGFWLDKSHILEEYRSIFRFYKAIGDNSVVGKWGRVITKPIERVFRVGLPGWHDLHASQ